MVQSMFYPMPHLSLDYNPQGKRGKGNEAGPKTTGDIPP